VGRRILLSMRTTTSLSQPKGVPMTYIFIALFSIGLIGLCWGCAMVYRKWAEEVNQRQVLLQSQRASRPTKCLGCNSINIEHSSPSLWDAQATEALTCWTCRTKWMRYIRDNQLSEWLETDTNIICDTRCTLCGHPIQRMVYTCSNDKMDLFYLCPYCYRRHREKISSSVRGWL